MEVLPRSCSEVQASLPLYVGADLEAPAMDAVGSHLLGCVVCAERHKRARQARSALRELRGLQVPIAGERSPELWGGIRERLLTEGILEPKGAQGPASKQMVPEGDHGPRSLELRWRSWGGVLAAAALVLALPLSLDWLRPPVGPALPDGSTSGDLSPAVAQPSDVVAQPILVANPSQSGAAGGTDVWVGAIRPLQPAGHPGPEESTLFRRALSGEASGTGGTTVLTGSSRSWPKIR